MRSPIHLDVTGPQWDPEVFVRYHDLNRIRLVDVGNTLSADLQPGGSVTIDDHSFSLVDTHCHTPSEHTIRGVRADLELHLVHQDAHGAISVVGVLFNRASGTHPIDVLITSPHTTDPPDDPFRVSRVLPHGSRRFLYMGTRTTPPLTKGVQWVIYETVQSVGTEALDAFADRYGPNNHPIHPVGDRSVSLIKPQVTTTSIGA